MIGDIRKMFHAIKMSELDQHTHRFLWRDIKLEQDPEEYVMLSVSFGNRPSGGIAIAALRKTAKISREQYPEAAQVLLNNVYMDDIIDSISTHAQTSRVSEDIDNILKSGNFNVKGWVLYNGEEKLKRRRKLEDDEEKINGSCDTQSVRFKLGFKN